MNTQNQKICSQTHCSAESILLSKKLESCLFSLPLVSFHGSVHSLHNVEPSRQQTVRIWNVQYALNHCSISWWCWDFCQEDAALLGQNRAPEKNTSPVNENNCFFLLSTYATKKQTQPYRLSMVQPIKVEFRVSLIFTGSIQYFVLTTCVLYIVFLPNWIFLSCFNGFAFRSL